MTKNNAIGGRNLTFEDLNCRLNEVIKQYFAKTGKDPKPDSFRVLESLAFISGSWCRDMQQRGDKRTFAELYAQFGVMMHGAYALRRMGWASRPPCANAVIRRQV